MKINKKVLVIKNISREGLGLFEEVLRKENIKFDLGEEEFPQPNGYSAVFVFGGPDSANDKTSKMQDELKRIKETIKAGIPYFGVCLGMQTLVKANGGEVYKNTIKEIGFRAPDGNYFEIDLANEGKKDPIFRGITSPLKIFHLHGETVSLRNGMSLLATGRHCRNQVVKVGKTAYGFQGHLELNKQTLEKWIKEDSDLNSISASHLRSDFKKLKAEYQNNGRIILTNFLKIAGLI
ncbi:type 1 glutamine amidotransferase [Candidatus Woesearchaeota archaeon]|nr:type 1 glutamine amidotransferase [Candidatus Woesearchaeota archaeon]